MSPATKRCPNPACGRENSPGEFYCLDCGDELDSVQSPIPRPFPNPRFPDAPATYPIAGSGPSKDAVYRNYAFVRHPRLPSLSGDGNPAKSAAQTITAYAPHLHAVLGDKHHAVSPVGAWLLLALVAQLATGADREALECALGCDAATARRAADALLQELHPAVGAAVAYWNARGIGAALESWRGTLSAEIATGPIPTQDEADAWVCKHTKGQFQKFPQQLTESVQMLLVSAVATDVAWDAPFETVPAAQLGGPWASRVRRAMRWRGDGARAVARTAAAGLVGVQVQQSRSGLAVVSVIAAPEVPAAAVLAAAYEVAALECGRPTQAVYVSLFDLPEEGHAWRIVEEVVKSLYERRAEIAEVTLPAWRVSSEARNLECADGTGFPEAARTLLRHLPPPQVVNATQSTRAEFDVAGFRAASVTKFSGIPGCAMPDRQATIRTIELKFTYPFAAVAVAFGWGNAHCPWHGVPAFGAWVTQPAEPSEGALPGAGSDPEQDFVDM